MNDSAFPVRDENQPEYGLTKLQYAAIHICASLQSHPNMGHEMTVEQLAELAVAQAKALFAELNRE